MIMQVERASLEQQAAVVCTIGCDDSFNALVRKACDLCEVPLVVHSTVPAFMGSAHHLRPGCAFVQADGEVGGRIEIPGMLRDRQSPMQVVLVTADATTTLVVRAMRAGVLDFVMTPSDHERLIEVLEGAMRRSTEQARSLAALARARTLVGRLTPRELEVMHLVVTGITNFEIAARLGISTRTVEVHRSRIMEKMEATSVAELVRLSISVLE